MTSPVSTIKIARQNNSQFPIIFRGMNSPASHMNQQYMSFEDIEKQFNDLSAFLDKIGKGFDVYATQMDRKDLEQISVFLIELSKRMFTKLKDLQEDKIDLQVVTKQNNDLKQQLRHLKQVNQELNDIKLLFEETTEKLKEKSQEQSMSLSCIEQLGAMSKELRNQLEIKQDEFQMNIQTKNKQLKELKLAIDKLKSQMIMQKQKQQQWQNVKLNLLQQIYSLEKVNIDCLQKIDIVQKQKQELNEKISQLQYSLMLKVEHSVKNRSLNNDSNSAISQRSLEDDHQILKNVETSFLHQDIKIHEPSSPYLQKQKSVIINELNQEKRKVNQEQVDTNRGPKSFVRRNTLSSTPGDQLVFTTIKNVKANKLTFNSSTKLQTAAFNRRFKRNNGFRSSGNSPSSASNQRLDLNSEIKNIHQNFNLRNMLKDEGNSAKNSDDISYEKLKQMYNGAQKQLRQAKKEIKNKQKSLQEMQITILDKGDQMTQLEGEIEMCNDRINELEYELEQSKQKEYESSFTLNQCKKRLSTQQLIFTKQKAKHEEQMQQLKQICQNFCKELNISKDQCDRWEHLCKKLKGELTNSKTKILEFEEALSEGVHSKVQNVFWRIYQEEKEEVKVYESPERVLSRRSSLQNSLRACQTDRVMATKSRQRKQSQQNISAHNACTGKQITSQMLRIGLQSLVGQGSNISNSQNSISPKEGSGPFSSSEQCGGSQQRQQANYQHEHYTNPISGENQLSQLSLDIKGMKNHYGQTLEHFNQNLMIEQEDIEGNANNQRSFFHAFDCKSNERQLKFISNVLEFFIQKQEKNLKNEVKQTFCQTNQKKFTISNKNYVQIQKYRKSSHLSREKVIDQTFYLQISHTSQSVQTSRNQLQFCLAIDIELSYNKQKIIENEKNSFQRQLRNADKDLKNDQWPSFWTDNIITAEYSNIQTVQKLMESIETQTQKFGVEFNQQTDNCQYQSKQIITNSCHKINFQTQTNLIQTIQYQVLTDSLVKTNDCTITQKIQICEVSTETEIIDHISVEIITESNVTEFQTQTQSSIFNNKLPQFLKEHGTTFEYMQESIAVQINTNNFYELQIIKDNQTQTYLLQKVNSQSQKSQQFVKNTLCKTLNLTIEPSTQGTSNSHCKQTISLNKHQDPNINKTAGSAKDSTFIQDNNSKQKPKIQSLKKSKKVPRKSLTNIKEDSSPQIIGPEEFRQQQESVTLSRAIEVEDPDTIQENRANNLMLQIEQKLKQQLRVTHSTVDFSEYLMKKSVRHQQKTQKSSIDYVDLSLQESHSSKISPYIGSSFEKSMQQPMDNARGSVNVSPVYEKLNIKSRHCSTQASPFQSKPNTERSQFDISNQLRKIKQEKQAEEDQKNSARRAKVSPSKQYTPDELLNLLAGRRNKPLQIKSPSLSYKHFEKEHGWDFKKKMYLLQCDKIQPNQDQDQKQLSGCRLILWRKGAIEMETKKYMLATQLGKVIKDKRYTILGNSQVIIERDQLSINKKKENSYFTGSLQDAKYKINNVYICE